MIVIDQEDFIISITNALHHINYYHPIDYIKALTKAFYLEKSLIAKNAIAQILINSRMCAKNRRPICQDTGIVTVFVKIGMNVSWKNATMNISEMINESVRRAYTNLNYTLRSSIVNPPDGIRKNTLNNTPAIIHYDFINEDKVYIHITAKGGGSENKSVFLSLNPSDSIIEYVINSVKNMGAGWCPPGILGIGIGGTPEKCMIMAKESLMKPINIDNVINKKKRTWEDNLRLDLYKKINNLGIGAQGLGGLFTVLDVKIMSMPTHAASKPVAIVPNCAATRHISFSIDRNGIEKINIPSLKLWPNISLENKYDYKEHININNLTKNETIRWKCGDTLLLSGKILTGRDIAHERITNILKKKEKLPISFRNRIIYYVGPINPVKGEIIGPAGPTTANRMDKFTEIMLKEAEIIAMIGKAERGIDTINMIKKYKVPYLIAVGGAAYLISKTICSSKIVAFHDLGMEAIYEFDVYRMPVIVAVDSYGRSIHYIGPKKWKIN